MRRLALLVSIAAAVSVAAAGCGGTDSGWRDPGDPAAVRMLAFAVHARTLTDTVDRAALALVHEGADARETRRLAARAGGDAARLRDDVERSVTIGARGRAPVVAAARWTSVAAHALVDYTADRRGPELALALARLSRSETALGAAATALARPAGAAFADELARLRAPLKGSS